MTRGAARRVMRLAALAMVLAAGPRPAPALDNSALQQIAPVCEGKVFRLQVDLHEPDAAGESMQAPTLERRGWHHHNPTGAVLLPAGAQVEVTGVFNYAERGLFLELAREQIGLTQDPLVSRPRIRIRIMVDALPGDRAGQVREATELIGKVLELPSSP